MYAQCQPGHWDDAMESELREAAAAREELEQEASHQRKQAGEWEAAAKAQASLVSGLKADLESERRATQRLQAELDAVAAERRVERRDRATLAGRLRSAEASADGAQERLAALQELLDVRDGEIAKLSAQLRESQAARGVLEGEERRLAAAISTLGGRVDGECKALRSEVAGLKSAVAEREQVIAQLKVSWAGGEREKCKCRDCVEKGDAETPLMTPNEFERHSGMAASKKWKYTIRVPQADGSEPELLGDWLEARGLDITVHGRAKRMQPAPPLSSDRGPGILSVPASARAQGEERPKGRPEGAPSTASAEPPSSARQPALARIATHPEPPLARSGSGVLPRWHTATGAFKTLPPSQPMTPRDAVGPDPSSLQPKGGPPTPSRDPRVLAQYLTMHPALRAAQTARAVPTQDRAVGPAPGLPGERAGKRPRRLPQRLTETVDPGEALGLMPALPNTKLGNEPASKSGPERVESGLTEARGTPMGAALDDAGRAPTQAAQTRADLVSSIKSVLQQNPATLSALSAALGLGTALQAPPAAEASAAPAARGRGPPAATPPQVASWSLVGADLHLTVRFEGRDYNGTLHGPAPGPQPFVRAPTRPRSVPQWAQGPLSSPALASSALAPRQQAASSAPRSSAPAPAPSTSAAPPAPPSLQAPERSRSQGDSGSELIERYWAKVRAGPEPGTRCALCHQPDAPLLARRELGPGGRARGALGPLVLVQPTRKTYAWVHDQCLRWSPEVAEGPAEGIRDLAGRAVLRGRGLRCKMCSAKGATLGCMTHCPTSLHLPCALRSKCLLVVQPYRVACAKHAQQMALQSSDEEEEEEEEPAGARQVPRPAPSGASARGPPSRGPSSRGPSSLVSSPRRRYWAIRGACKVALVP
ncbi:hypothetical protein QBZ16_000516 [Prototheca wickerhamii]|uniref:Uncharacterized protein n=1 Tax=Prototheca wickerhamii TaxID=3111 RepID=A0AAD9IPI0_PROWI|nr:hypothetical protein QBZ16_000516 [Prototheca wickerhamii]